MDVDDFSDIQENFVDTSSPGTVSQRVKRLDSHFSQNPDGFSSHSPSEQHLFRLTSPAPTVGTPGSGYSLEEQPKKRIAGREKERSSRNSFPNRVMAIGRIPSSEQTEPADDSLKATSELAPSPAQGTVPASEIQILEHDPVEHDHAKDEAPPNPEIPAENSAPKKAASASEAKEKAKGNKSTEKSASKGSAASPSISKAGRVTGKSRFTIPEPFSLATDRRANLFTTRLSEAPSVISSKPKAGVVRASFDAPQVPPKPSPKPATSPEPFRLASLKRHEEAQERLKAGLRAKAKVEEEKRNFKAIPILQSAAPAPSPVRGSPATKSSSFKFALDSRADKRIEFSKMLDEKTSLRLQERKNILEKNKAELEEEMKEFRSKLTFKATPMPSFYKKTRDGSSSVSKSAPATPMARRSTEVVTSSAEIRQTRASFLRSSMAKADASLKPVRTRSEAQTQAVSRPAVPAVTRRNSLTTTTVSAASKVTAKPRAGPAAAAAAAAGKKASLSKPAEAKKPAAPASRLSSLTKSQSASPATARRASVTAAGALNPSRLTPVRTSASKSSPVRA